MAISDWPESERPREKLLKNGAANLSDAELLAIFLRTGMAGKSAVDLARELLTEFDGLTGLFSADQSAFSEVRGMGPAKYAQLQAVLEMARRALAEKMKSGDAMSSPQSVRDYLRLTLQGKKYEIFVGIFLDAQNRTIAAEELFKGTLHHNAAAIIFAHNHPSGLAEPSRADEILTQSLKQALALVDVNVLDHFIVGAGSVMSFAERGLI